MIVLFFADTLCPLYIFVLGLGFTHLCRLVNTVCPPLGLVIFTEKQLKLQFGVVDCSQSCQSVPLAVVHFKAHCHSNMMLVTLCRRKREAEEKALQEMKRQEELRQQQEDEKQRQREVEKQQEAEAAQRKQVNPTCSQAALVDLGL